MAAITRTATVAWTGDLVTGSGTLTTQSTALTTSPISAPRRFSDPNGETSPEELLAGAHAGCFAMSLAGACVREGYAGAQLEVEAEVSIKRLEGRWTITASRLTVEAAAEGLTNDTLQSLVAAADSSCPVSALLRPTAKITIEANLG